MIKNFGNINTNLLTEICSSFDSVSNLKLVREQFPNIDHIMLYSILYSTGKYNDKLIGALPQLFIPENKILIMSDTHYGSIFEELRYTYEVFEFAKANGIRIILHGGDIIEGNIKRRRGMSSIKQANYFIERYPYDDGITTHALFGNHDFLAITRNPEVGEVLSSREDVLPLGYKKAYINFNGTIISLQHEIEDYKLCLPPKGEYISFGGHSHFYHVRDKKRWKNEKIYIPALCNDKVYLASTTPKTSFNDANYKPGFLVAEVDDTSINVTNYSFTSNGIVKQKEFQKTLKKKVL